jgi:hypothetical protein
MFVNHLMTFTKSNAEIITQTTFSSGFYIADLKTFFIQGLSTISIFSTNIEADSMVRPAFNGKCAGIPNNYLSTLSKANGIVKLFSMPTFVPLIWDYKQSIKQTNKLKLYTLCF